MYYEKFDTYMPIRYAYNVVIRLHVTEANGPGVTTYTTTVISDDELASDEVISRATEIIQELHVKGEEFQQYSAVQVGGVTMLGAYDRELQSG